VDLLLRLLGMARPNGWWLIYGLIILIMDSIKVSSILSFAAISAQPLYAAPSLLVCINSGDQ
jgi:hypothetical protein